jgi:hypothetical protein
MNEKEIDRVLQEIASEPIRSLPADFSKNVWHEIHRRESLAVQPSRFSVWLDGFLPMLQETRLAFGTFAVALGVGIFLGLSFFTQNISPASEAMDLQVFSAEARGIPSTLLAQRL